ncbi:MAG TPA: thiol:disulfide interchange protein DsbA/DsbL [Steroidobacteraceae bacterium]|nr:thiol:disulfide interchange protein DsbA/DsbL [Steroidobacteraceae bacterium]
MKPLLLALGLAAAALAGCSQKPVAPAPASSSEPAASATSPAADAAPAAAPSTPAAPETAVTPAAPNAPIAQTLAGHWQIGKNYEAVVPAQPTNADPGQVEVIEFLWLGCPHCYELNPYVEAWKKKLPPYVKFVQEHVTWDAVKTSHARLFYTIEALGRDDLVAKAFDEIHRKGNVLVGKTDAETQQLQQTFAVENGIKADDFQQTSTGFTVSTKLQHANELMRVYRVDSVPTFIVNGRYRTDVGMAGGPTQLIQLVNDLAASEKNH